MSTPSTPNGGGGSGAGNDAFVTARTTVASPSPSPTTTAALRPAPTAAPAAGASGAAQTSFNVDFNMFVQLLNQGSLHKDALYYGMPILHYAAFHARQDIVRELLARGAKLTTMPVRNLSPLHFACNKDRRLCSAEEDIARASIVRMLVSNAVQLDVQESRGWTALKFAVGNGLVHCVEALLDCNANPDLPDKDGYRPLHNAVVKAMEMPDGEGYRMLQLLLSRVRDVNAVNARRQTPLLLSLLQRDFRSSELLLHYYADPNAMDADGNTPLIIAANIGEDSMVSVLLSRGAHVNLVSTCRQRTALHYAVEAGVSNIVRFLLRCGADVYIRDSSGETPLSLSSGDLLNLIRACAAVQAAESGDANRLGELYRDGLDINAVDVASKLPLLHRAACSGQPDVVHFLLRNGAFVNEANTQGNTALHFACVTELPHRNYAETLRQLLNSGADINAQNSDGDTPLHLAAARGFNLRVSMLLKTAGAHQLIVNKRGELALHKACCHNQACMSVFILMEGLQTACLNRPCARGWTPLMFAVKSSSTDIVNYLLDECGADVNATQTEGYTALHLAVQSRHAAKRAQLCRKLVEHKANPNVQAGSKKLTPLHYVCAKGIEDICLLLAENGGDLLQPDAEGDSALAMVPTETTSEEFRAKLQECTKDCPDEALVRSWTCTPPVARQGGPVTMSTAAPEDRRYDALPSHTQLMTASGVSVTDAGSVVDVPRVQLTHSAFKVAQRIIGGQGGSADGGGGVLGAAESSDSEMSAIDSASARHSVGVATTGLANSSLAGHRHTSDQAVGVASLHNAATGMRVAYYGRGRSTSGGDDVMLSIDSRTRTIKGDVDVAFAAIGALSHVGGDDDTLRLDTDHTGLGHLYKSDALRNIFQGMESLSRQIKIPEADEDDRRESVAIPTSAGLTQIPLSELPKETELGSGSYSDVYGSTYLDKPVAVKLFRNMTGDEVKRIFQQEVIMLSKMSHANVLNIIGYCHDIDGHAIVTDLLERGSLQDVLAEQGLQLDWLLRLKMLHHTSLGMQYLHKCQLLHRDLKSGNLLVGSDFNVQIADFGMIKVRQHTVTMTTSFRGTPAYIAPETFDTKSHSEASDVYAFSIILFEVASRKTPYYENRHLRLMELMMSVLRGSRPTMDAETLAKNSPLPDEYRDVMQQCWHEDFRQRPNFTEIVSAIRRMQGSVSTKPPPS